MSAPTLKVRVGRWLYPRLPITRFLFEQLRIEGRAVCVASQNRLLPSRRARLRRLRQDREVWVNVACGPQILDGFVNLDLLPASSAVISWDCRRGLPLSDNCAAGIRAEQFVEHLEPREDLPAFLLDCRRVLKSGGVLRAIVPDAGRYLRAYCRPELDGFRELAVPIPFPDDLPTRMDIINHVFHQWDEHRWAYDFETLGLRLRSAGFVEITETSYGVSLAPRLAEDRAVHASSSLYVDARKP